MKKLLIVLLAIGIVLSSGCTQQTQELTQEAMHLENVNWLDVELKDIATSKTFKISDFKGQKIMLESFAVWCPTCLKQQRETITLKGIDPDIVHISLDTDPNENEGLVRDHIETHGFDWYFAVAPISMTQALINEFGFDIVNAPTAPVVLICEDQSARFLMRGLKSASELKEEAEKGC
jgi:thiol-disulfide isomerase/thioredoxin